MIERTLREGAASLPTLAAITGFDERKLKPILDKLINAEEKQVIKLSAGRLERYQWVD